MADGAHTTSANLLLAQDLAPALPLREAPANGMRYASFGDTKVADAELERLLGAVPIPVARALTGRAFYFVPLALPENFREDAQRGPAERTLISPVYTSELSDEAICHRNVSVAASEAGGRAHEGVFISARLLRDTFALAFELFINVAHAFTAEAGIPETFSALAWSQAVADVRGETSQDAWESRRDAISGPPQLVPARAAEMPHRAKPDEKSKSEFLETAFADALAIYMLSLAIDFDYSELREREYPLLAPSALADRLRLVAGLFPPNTGYEFAIRYRRRG